MNKSLCPAAGLLDETEISPVVNIVAGTTVIWDGKGLNIILVGETEVVLSGENNQLIKLKKAIFENLVRQGEITSNHFH